MRSILTISPVVIGLLTGCATKQTWVPELEQAQSTFVAISQDPVVAGLAQDELLLAERQLRSAEEAAAAFRKPQSVAHKAQLAELQTLTAQQRARALSASHSVQIALGQDPLLPQEKIAAASFRPPAPTTEPVMAAASPGSNAEIQAQLKVLSQQLANLQAKLAGSQSQESTLPDVAAVEPTESQMPAPASKPQPNSLDESPIPVVELPAAASTASMVMPMDGVEKLTSKAQSKPSFTAVATESGSLQDNYTTRQVQQKLRAMNAKPNVRGMSLLLGERYFDNGSDRLMSHRAARHLDNVAALLEQNPGLSLIIEGHTDDELSETEKQDLSTNRAISVKSALVVRGVETDRISTQGFGDTRPIADNRSDLGRLQNRRVELIFPIAQADN